jgi:hypothetical protein
MVRKKTRTGAESDMRRLITELLRDMPPLEDLGRGFLVLYLDS